MRYQVTGGDDRLTVTYVPNNVPSDRRTYVVKTYADGHGVWHATFSTSENPRRDARIARAAIAYELACREGASAANYLKVRRETNDPRALPGRVCYREV